MSTLEPIPETVEAVAELDGWDDEVVLEQLVRLTGQAKLIVPELVGASIARVEHELSFTLVATAEEIAALDGVQYVADGPCARGARTDEPQQFRADDRLDEEHWQLFAAATAAHAVRSTLTLLVHDDEGSVVGTVNLYAASSQAFAGHHAALAEVFGAWASGAITNADLSFATLAAARRAPDRARDLLAVEVAVGYLAALIGVDVDTADERLRAAAVRAGTTPARLAREVVAARQGGASAGL